MKPEWIFHLAAQSFVPTSWDQATLTGEFTALGVSAEVIKQLYLSRGFTLTLHTALAGSLREVSVPGCATIACAGVAM
mgnify:CR=1 FL=1